VIGSGPGGSVTAWTLASQGKDVLLLEEGPHLPLSSCVPFSIDEMRQKYRSGGMNPALGKPTIPFVEACCAGGGSEINSGMYHRTPEEVLDVWRTQFQVQYLEMEDLLPHFEACESALCVQLDPGKPPGAATKMRTGADKMGWKSREIPKWFKYQKGAIRQRKVSRPTPVNDRNSNSACYGARMPIHDSGACRATPTEK